MVSKMPRKATRSKEVKALPFPRMSWKSRWVLGWIDLFTGIVTILCAGAWNPEWSLTYCFWDSHRRWEKKHGKNPYGEEK